MERTTRYCVPRGQAGLLSALTLFFLSAHCSAGSGIATDGSVGARQTIAGANAGAGSYQIPQTLGTLSGNNLFHSFSTFNIGSGQTAIFTTTTETISNVVSRVTGGSISQINGLLRLKPATGSAPAFFFINPAGVLFGTGAAVSVPGAFHISTADYLQLAKGERFYATLGKASTLSSSAPAAFGFLGGAVAAISVKEGAIVSAQPTYPLTIVSSDIEINNGAVTAQRGDVRVVAIGKAVQEVGLADGLPAALGNLDIVNGGEISSSAGGLGTAGTVKVSAGNITIDGQGNNGSATGIFYNAQSGVTGSAGSVEVAAKESLSIANNGSVSSSTWSSGNAGTVKVSADTIVVDGQRSNGSATGIFSNAGSGSSGDAGKVDVVARESLSIRNSGSISSSTWSVGNAGAVKVSATAIAIDGQANSGSATGIFSDANKGSSGDAGSVEVVAEGRLVIANSGTISSNTASSGKAGSVNVAADSIAIINPANSVFATGIFSNAIDGATGNAGSLEIAASGSLFIANSGRISSSTEAFGNAGVVKVNAGSIEIDGQGNSDFATGIMSDATSSSKGNGGSVVVVAAGNLSIANGGRISSNTWSLGNAGSVMVSAGSLAIDSRGNNNFTTGIFSNARFGSKGDAGSVEVKAVANLSLVNGGSISSSTWASGDAGSVKVSADRIDIDGKGRATGVSSEASYGSIGNAGSVEVKAAGNLSIMDSGGITTGTYGSGNAGSIKISSGSMNIDGKGGATGVFSEANDGSSGNAGSIEVSVPGNLSMVNYGGITAGTYGSGNAGTIKVSAGSIDIDGKGGVSGVFSNANFGSTGTAGSIDVLASSTLSMVDGGLIVSSTASPGDAGHVKVSAGSIAIDGLNRAGLLAGIYSESYATNQTSSGNGGDIAVTADILALTRSGFISAATDSNGRGGTIALQVRSISLTAGGAISATTSGSGNGGNITIRDADDVTFSGVGDVSWQQARDGKQVTGQFSGIYINSQGSGNGGDLQLSTKSLTLSDGGGITAIAMDGKVASLPETRAGNIHVDAERIVMSGGGAIAASTSSAGQAGSIAINASESITISGQFDRNKYAYVTNPRTTEKSGIDSSSTYAQNRNAKTLGPGGDVSVTTPVLILNNGGEVRVSTEGEQSAGSIKIGAGTLLVDGATSRIDASATKTSSGQTGSVNIIATGNVAISNGGSISITNDASVDNPESIKPTTLMVLTPNITLKDAQITAASSGNVAAGSIRIAASNKLHLDSSNIATTARDGNGGAIDIAAGTVWLEKSQIATSVTGPLNGNGGNIAIAANSLIMNTGFIQANTNAVNASGGLVSISAQNLIPSGNTLLLGGSMPYAFQPGVFGFNVIQAAAPTGVSGVPQVSAPALDVSSSLVALNARMMRDDQLARRPCENSNGSSLASVGRGGLPLTGADFLSPGQLINSGQVVSQPLTAATPAERTALRPSIFTPCLAAL